MFRNPRTNTSRHLSGILRARRFSLSAPRADRSSATSRHVYIYISQSTCPILSYTDTRAPHSRHTHTNTYTWNRLHSDCCELSGRVATAVKGRGRRDSGARFGGCSHRHDIIRGGKIRSGGPRQGRGPNPVEDEFRNKKGQDLRNRARENGMCG